MKKINFPLRKPVRLTPLKGDTEVYIETSGDVIVSDYVPAARKKEPRIRVASTERAELSSSPKGYLFTLKIILPAEIATEREFHKQVNLLFDSMLQE